MQEYGIQTLSEAQSVARRLGPTFKAARGNNGWFTIDTSAPMWHSLTDEELASIGLKRTDLAEMRRR